MADLHPFRAVRPHPDAVSDVCCVPYDVVSTAEARELASGRSRSFLRVIRPEVELPDTDDSHAPEVYEQGGANMQAFIDAAYTVREEEPALYVYRVDTEIGTQTGVFGCVSVKDYDNRVILKHEATRPDKVKDRARHMQVQEAHAEPVMLTYRGTDTLDALTESVMDSDPLFDFHDGSARHILWKVPTTEVWQDAFAEIQRLYIADGHHRCKAASRVAHMYRQNGKSNSEAEYFPAVLFPMHDMHIMAYNRVLSGLSISADALLNQLEKAYTLTRNVRRNTPSQKGHVCIYAAGAWHDLELPPGKKNRTVDQLDVSRLTYGVLRPVLDITDPRRDTRIGYVGGIRGPEALARCVDKGEAEVGISMYPTSIEELVTVSDEGDLMPPKSTWFEPKLISGMLVHTF